MTTRIAVVEDDDELLESIVDMLASVGYAVRAFDSAEAFLAADTQNFVDCLITDITMSGLSGLQLREHLGMVRPDLPVLIMTGDIDTHHAHRIDPGRFFQKPFDGDALLDAVAGAVADRK